ncbi:MAG: hypothetical protein LBV34_21640, partial [Nocardiopsaceae bacterium]|nr:hypothetical protein [Nocardiopsaceae bacterium]
MDVKDVLRLWQEWYAYRDGELSRLRAIIAGRASEAGHVRLADGKDAARELENVVSQLRAMLARLPVHPGWDLADQVRQAHETATEAAAALDLAWADPWSDPDRGFGDGPVLVGGGRPAGVRRPLWVRLAEAREADELPPGGPPVRAAKPGTTAYGSARPPEAGPLDMPDATEHPIELRKTYDSGELRFSVVPVNDVGDVTGKPEQWSVPVASSDGGGYLWTRVQFERDEVVVSTLAGQRAETETWTHRFPVPHGKRLSADQSKNRERKIRTQKLLNRTARYLNDHENAVPVQSVAAIVEVGSVRGAVPGTARKPGVVFSSTDLLFADGSESPREGEQLLAVADLTRGESDVRVRLYHVDEETGAVLDPVPLAESGPDPDSRGVLVSEADVANMREARNGLVFYQGPDDSMFFDQGVRDLLSVDQFLAQRDVSLSEAGAAVRAPGGKRGAGNQELATAKRAKTGVLVPVGIVRTTVSEPESSRAGVVDRDEIGPVPDEPEPPPDIDETFVKPHDAIHEQAIQIVREQTVVVELARWKMFKEAIGLVDGVLRHRTEESAEGESAEGERAARERAAREYADVIGACMGASTSPVKLPENARFSSLDAISAAAAGFEGEPSPDDRKWAMEIIYKTNVVKKLRDIDKRTQRTLVADLAKLLILHGQTFTRFQLEELADEAGRTAGTLRPRRAVGMKLRGAGPGISVAADVGLPERRRAESGVDEPVSAGRVFEDRGAEMMRAFRRLRVMLGRAAAGVRSLNGATAQRVSASRPAVGTGTGTERDLRTVLAGLATAAVESHEPKGPGDLPPNLLMPARTDQAVGPDAIAPVAAAEPLPEAADRFGRHAAWIVGQTHDVDYLRSRRLHRRVVQGLAAALRAGLSSAEARETSLLIGGGLGSRVPEQGAARSAPKVRLRGTDRTLQNGAEVRTAAELLPLPSGQDRIDLENVLRQT